MQHGVNAKNKEAESRKTAICRCHRSGKTDQKTGALPWFIM